MTNIKICFSSTSGFSKASQNVLAGSGSTVFTFAALTGYDDALRETARLTEHFIELEEDRKQEIDRQLSYLREHLANPIIVRITYFYRTTKKKVEHIVRWKGGSVK